MLNLNTCFSGSTVRKDGLISDKYIRMGPVSTYLMAFMILPDFKSKNISTNSSTVKADTVLYENYC